MTRALPLAAAALLVALACSAPDAPQATPTPAPVAPPADLPPVVVHIQVPEDPEPEGEGEIMVMRGALVVGESARTFNLVYRGDARPQAEALARNLRRFAAEGAAAAAEPEESTDPAGEETEAEVDDQG